MRRGPELGVLVVFVLIGYGVASVLGAPSLVDPSVTPGPGPRTQLEVSTTMSPDTTSTTASRQIYLVWASGGLPPDFVTALVERFEEVSVVRGDVVELETGADGWVVPLDALAIDPVAHSPFDPGGSLGGLSPGTVVLGASSAELRGVGSGEGIRIGGIDYEVAAVAPDEVVAAAEVVFAKDDPTAPVITDRFALIASDQPRKQLEEAVRSLYHGPAPLRIRSQGETPWLRHGDAVLPQVFIKSALGEFSYRDRSGARFTPDPDWVDEHIISTDVPILGRVTCHRRVVEMLQGALGELVDQGLSHLVDPSEYAGCWNPRFIRTITGELAGISRHAWGAAVDINAASNPMGSTGDQDPRLVEIMQRWGFTWGGDWLVPDSMHFEYGIQPGD